VRCMNFAPPGANSTMRSLSYRGHRFPACIIQHAIWLYLRFTLSYRDVEELLAERRLDLFYETIRRWVLKFGPAISARPAPAAPRLNPMGFDPLATSLIRTDRTPMAEIGASRSLPRFQRRSPSLSRPMSSSSPMT